MLSYKQCKFTAQARLMIEVRRECHLPFDTVFIPQSPLVQARRHVEVRDCGEGDEIRCSASHFSILMLQYREIPVTYGVAE